MFIGIKFQYLLIKLFAFFEVLREVINSKWIL